MGIQQFLPRVAPSEESISTSMIDDIEEGVNKTLGKEQRCVQKCPSRRAGYTQCLHAHAGVNAFLLFGCVHQTEGMMMSSGAADRLAWDAIIDKGNESENNHKTK